MLVVAYEFPSRSGATISDLITTAKGWLCGSPHYPWNDVAQLPEPTNSICMSQLSGHTVEIGRADLEQHNIGGLRHSWTEGSAREWVTEIVGIQKDNRLWVTVRVFCDLLKPGQEIPSARKPHVVKEIFAQIGGGEDGPLVVSDETHILKEADVQLAANLMRGTAENRLPIVYISVDFYGRPFIDAGKIAQWVSGLAHVVLEPSRFFSHTLSKEVDSINAFGGAVGIYWPGAEGDHMRVLPRQFGTPEKMEAEISRRLRTFATFIRPENNCTWPALRQQVANIESQKVRSNDASSLEDYVAAFDAEISAAKSRIDELEANELRLRSTLRRSENSAPSILAAGKEQDLYEDETLDIIIGLIEKGITDAVPDSRRQHVLESLARSNEKLGKADDIITDLKFLSSAQTIGPNEIQSLTRSGFRVTDGGKHYKAIFFDDPRYTFSVYKTASDHRSGKNLLSDIRKKLFR